jgi:hypothetical protein
MPCRSTVEQGGEGDRDAGPHEYRPRELSDDPKISTRYHAIETYTDLLKTTLDEVVTRQPDVFRGAKTFEQDLVLVRLLELLAGSKPRRGYPSGLQR